MVSFILIFSTIFINRFMTFGTRAIEGIKNNKKKLLFIVLSLGVLTLLNCLRGAKVGNDTESYNLIFNYFAKNNNDFAYAEVYLNSLEVGYVYLNRIFGYFSTNYQLFISIIAIFLYLVLGKTIYKHSDNVAISVIIAFLLLFHIYINVLREAIAISLIFIGYNLLTKNKKIWFYIFVFFAVLFHKSAFVALVIPFFYKKKAISSAIWMVFLTLMTVLSFTRAFSFFLNIISYQTKYLSEDSGLSIILGGVFVVIIILFLKLLKVNKSMLSARDLKTYNLFCAIPLTQLAFQICAMDLQIMFRFGYYFMAFYILIIPFFIRHSSLSKSKKNTIIVLLVIVVITYVVGQLLLRPEWYSEFNYYFYWRD